MMINGCFERNNNNNNKRVVTRRTLFRFDALRCEVIAFAVQYRLMRSLINYINCIRNSSADHRSHTWKDHILMIDSRAETNEKMRYKCCRLYGFSITSTFQMLHLIDVNVHLGPFIHLSCSSFSGWEFNQRVGNNFMRFLNRHVRFVSRFVV